jgi:hypothetical protein
VFSVAGLLAFVIGSDVVSVRWMFQPGRRSLVAVYGQ